MISDQPMNASLIRRLLITLLCAGFVLIAVGPCLYVANEGFGDPPGPLDDSLRARKLSYVLIPVGSLVAISASVGLVIVDRRHGRKSNVE